MLSKINSFTLIGLNGVKIDIEDERKVFIATHDSAMAQKAKEIILNIVTDIEVGKQYKGKVVRIMSFGAFVDLGGDKEGMIHISKLSDRRVEKVEDILNLGDDVLVECIKVDDKNRVDFKLISKC